MANKSSNQSKPKPKTISQLKAEAHALAQIEIKQMMSTVTKQKSKPFELSTLEVGSFVRMPSGEICKVEFVNFSRAQVRPLTKKNVAIKPVFGEKVVGFSVGADSYNISPHSQLEVIDPKDVDRLMAENESKENKKSKKKPTKASKEFLANVFDAEVKDNPGLKTAVAFVDAKPKQDHFGKIECPICSKMISKGGAAQWSHRMSHQKKGETVPASAPKMKKK